jgi:hypothetical protein
MSRVRPGQHYHKTIRDGRQRNKKRTRDLADYWPQLARVVTQANHVRVIWESFSTRGTDATIMALVRVSVGMSAVIMCLGAAVLPES